MIPARSGKDHWRASRIAHLDAASRDHLANRRQSGLGFKGGLRYFWNGDENLVVVAAREQVWQQAWMGMQNQLGFGGDGHARRFDASADAARPAHAIEILDQAIRQIHRRASVRAQGSAQAERRPGAQIAADEIVRGRCIKAPRLRQRWIAP